MWTKEKFAAKGWVSLEKLFILLTKTSRVFKGHKVTEHHKTEKGST